MGPVRDGPAGAVPIGCDVWLRSPLCAQADHADLMPESGEVVQVEQNGVDPMREHGRNDVRIVDRPARAFDRVEQ